MLLILEWIYFSYRETDYKKKCFHPKFLRKKIRKPNYYINEGGYGDIGAEGAKAILNR